MTGLSCSIMIGVSVWMTRLPDHALGSVVNYGSRELLYGNADYRGYNPRGYFGVLAVMSPADLGDAFWLRSPLSGRWWGPYLGVDVSRRDDFCANVGWRQEVAEVDRQTLDLLSQSQACCILYGVEMLRVGAEPAEPVSYREAVDWVFLGPGEHDPSPRPAIWPEQRIDYATDRGGRR